MLVVSLLVLSIFIGAIILSIHNSDEIHQIVAFLSLLITLICFFILSPLLIKSLLGLSFFTIGYKLFPAYRSLK
jgi:hypothetical protein